MSTPYETTQPEQVQARRGPLLPAVAPLLPDPKGGSQLAIIDIDSDERGDGLRTGAEMVFNTTRRMRLARGAAMLDEQGNYVELPPPPRPGGLRVALIALGRLLRLYRPPQVKTDWTRFFDPDLLKFDQLNEGALERIDSLERAGWRIVFLTSLPDSCFEARKQQMFAAGLLGGGERGLICKPACAQYLKTKYWKALVVAGSRTHHYLELSDKEYRLLPDLLEFFPWVARGLLDHYKSGHLLFIDDEAENRRQVMNTLQWFAPVEVESFVYDELAQLDQFLESGVVPS